MNQEDDYQRRQNADVQRVEARQRVVAIFWPADDYLLRG